MKVKVCGVRDQSFAAEAVRFGVDYLGFIFEPASPRFILPGKAKMISSCIRRSCEASSARKPALVGVFVKQSVAEILDVMSLVGLDVVQLHRRASADDVAALRTAGREVWTLAGGAEGDGVLFDSSHGDGDTEFRRGGFKTILAGRIGVGNIGDAIRLSPDVIDVNSSVETAPGVKSPMLLAAFIAELDRLLRPRR